jgi:hypothetical protein
LCRNGLDFQVSRDYFAWVIRRDGEVIQAPGTPLPSITSPATSQTPSVSVFEHQNRLYDSLILPQATTHSTAAIEGDADPFETGPFVESSGAGIARNQ